jgi:hypothetical protein
MHILVAVTVLVAAPLVDDIRPHADAILEHQLDDGAIVHYDDGNEIAIVPYFGNCAALGLFEAYRVTEDEKYLDAAVAWTEWYLAHMGLNGLVCDYRGTRDEYGPTGSVDASDSAAATFLMCANTRRVLTHDWRFVLREQSKLWKSYMLMLSTADVDGLTFAKADYPHKFTMDNAEVYDGMWHARQIARTLRDYSWNRRVYFARRKLKEGFAELRGEDGLYAWGKTDAGVFLTAEQSDEFYPAGLANLYAVALGPLKSCQAKDTFRATREQYPELNAYAADHLYWWVAAAMKAKDKATAKAALATLAAKVNERALAVDHAAYIRAASLVKDGPPPRPGVVMGSTFIAVPRQAVR